LKTPVEPVEGEMENEGMIFQSRNEIFTLAVMMEEL